MEFYDLTSERGYEGIIVTAPEPAVKQFEDLLHHGSDVLDMGAHSGRNSIYLAMQGHNVFALEKEEDYARAGNKTAKQLGEVAASHSFVVGDIRQPVFHHKFDGVMSSYVLQLVSRQEALAAIDSFNELTKPGGLNLLQVYTGSPDDQRHKPNLHLFRHEEIVDIYRRKGWDIVHKEGIARPLQQQGDTLYVTSKRTVIARKPQRTIRQRSIMNANREIVYFDQSEIV